MKKKSNKKMVISTFTITIVAIALTIVTSIADKRWEHDLWAAFFFYGVVYSVIGVMAWLAINSD